MHSTVQLVHKDDIDATVQLFVWLKGVESQHLEGVKERTLST
ncbi:TPA: hypothetical protein DCE37_26175 [Candidatus Latescibacteria bacterium]|nr:hypothetical protein [Candidatus Latescibacterota bacterium]